eukprot:519869-Karenia_brevis.AAC.1
MVGKTTLLQPRPLNLKRTIPEILFRFTYGMRSEMKGINALNLEGPDWLNFSRRGPHNGHVNASPIT